MRIAALGLVLPIVLGASLFAQRPPPLSQGSNSATMPISATTKMSFHISHDGATETLDLLVLWRGAPGWFMEARAAGGNTGGGGGGSNGDEWWMQDRSGDLKLDLRMNRRTRTVWVQGVELSLGPANAILVDQVGAPGGPAVVSLLTVDATPGDEPSPFRALAFLARSRELRDYVQCETPLPDANQQQLLAPVCARIAALSLAPSPIR